MTAANQPPQHEERLTSWLRQHGPAVRGYLRAMVRREDVADDLLQEVFHRAWQARDTYRENGTARAYLMRIADRLVCDRARQPTHEVNLGEKGWQQVEPSGSESEPADLLTQSESRRQLAAALDVLSPPQRRVLLLRYYSDMSFVEIAATMDCPLGTALSHCRRGLLALRKILAEQPQ